MGPTQCSETSAFNTQTPEKYPEDNSSIKIRLIVQLVGCFTEYENQDGVFSHHNYRMVNKKARKST
jgi:hypothetical protein